MTTISAVYDDDDDGDGEGSHQRREKNLNFDIFAANCGCQKVDRAPRLHSFDIQPSNTTQTISLGLTIYSSHSVTISLHHTSIHSHAIQKKNKTTKHFQLRLVALPLGSLSRELFLTSHFQRHQ